MIANSRYYFFAIITLIVGSLLLGVISDLSSRWWLLALLVFICLVGFHNTRKLSRAGRAVFTGFLFAIVVALARDYVVVMYKNVVDPPNWDFGLFWLYGQVADKGLNVYDVTNLQELARANAFSDDAIAAAYFFYPPPTLFYMAPLGWFEIHTASLGWTIAHVVLLICCVFLLWKLFLKDSGILGLGFVSALVLMLHSSLSDFIFEQTHFLLLLMVLLFWRYRTLAQGTTWLALAIFVKPLAAVLGLFLLLRRNWKAGVWLVGTMAVLCLLTVVVFGKDNFFGYFSANPVSDVPRDWYDASGTESLLTALIQLTHFDVNAGSPYIMPSFILVASVLLGITAWLTFYLKDDDLILALLILLGLLLYPNTLHHYGVLLLVPIFVLWKRREWYFNHYWVPVILITLTYVLVQVQAGYVTFIAILLNWIVLVSISGGVSFLIKQPEPAVIAVRNMDSPNE